MKLSFEFFTNTQRHQRLYYVETKNPAIKCYLGSQPFRSNALLSELSRHVLLGISLNCLLFLHHFIVGLISFS